MSLVRRSARRCQSSSATSAGEAATYALGFGLDLDAGWSIQSEAVEDLMTSSACVMDSLRKVTLTVTGPRHTAGPSWWVFHFSRHVVSSCDERSCGQNRPATDELPPTDRMM